MNKFLSLILYKAYTQCSGTYCIDITLYVCVWLRAVSMELDILQPFAYCCCSTRISLHFSLVIYKINGFSLRYILWQKRLIRTSQFFLSPANCTIPALFYMHTWYLCKLRIWWACLKECCMLRLHDFFFIYQKSSCVISL